MISERNLQTRGISKGHYGRCRGDIRLSGEVGIQAGGHCARLWRSLTPSIVISSMKRLAWKFHSDQWVGKAKKSARGSCKRCWQLGRWWGKMVALYWQRDNWEGDVAGDGQATKENGPGFLTWAEGQSWSRFERENQGLRLGCARSRCHQVVLQRSWASLDGLRNLRATEDMALFFVEKKGEKDNRVQNRTWECWRRNRVHK